MLHCYNFVHKGNNRSKCQDVCMVKETTNGIIIALSDGVSSKLYGDVGAAAIHNLLYNELQHNHNIRYYGEEEMKFWIASVIKETLYELSQSSGCKIDEYASTLMVVIKPTDSSYYWVIHIGDGMIGIVNNSQEILVLSRPRNGVMKNYTYTTVSGNPMYTLQVKKYDLLGNIFMMTDGIIDEIFRNDEYIQYFIQRDWKMLERRLLKEKLNDDIGFCSICLSAN